MKCRFSSAVLHFLVRLFNHLYSKGHGQTAKMFKFSIEELAIKMRILSYRESHRYLELLGRSVRKQNGSEATQILETRWYVRGGQC